MHAFEGEIAADEQAPLPGERRVEGGAERADGGNGGDAERDADHKNGEAAGSGTELAQRDGKCKRQPQAAPRRRRSVVGGGHDAAARRLAPADVTRPRVTRPSARLTV